MVILQICIYCREHMIGGGHAWQEQGDARFDEHCGVVLYDLSFSMTLYVSCEFWTRMGLRCVSQFHSRYISHGM